MLKYAGRGQSNLVDNSFAKILFKKNYIKLTNNVYAFKIKYVIEISGCDISYAIHFVSKICLKSDAPFRKLIMLLS